MCAEVTKQGSLPHKGLLCPVFIRAWPGHLRYNKGNSSKSYLCGSGVYSLQGKH